MNAPPNPPFRVLLYYLYVPIENPIEFAEMHRQFCAEHELRGRILIAGEGINGTVSGSFDATEAYMQAMHSDDRFNEMVFKIDPAEDHVFPKLSVKVRDEIVTLGLESETDIDPNAVTGTRLSPREFREAMKDEDAVIIDGRNDYESALGHFKGAVCPPLRNFREFPDWLRRNAQDLRGKKILTYCTGGIRCEKLSGFLRQEGFHDVYQLEGGIVSYAKDAEVRGEDFEGLCYVFDERVGVEANFTPSRKIISHCRYCGAPEPAYGNCRFPDCNEQIFVCGNCRTNHGLYCDPDCRSSHTGVDETVTPLESEIR